MWHHMAQTFWHSSSHVLGEALEAVFGADLTIGPAIDDGFYYDCFLGDRTLGDSDKDAINKKISEVHRGVRPHDEMAGLICRLGDARHTGTVQLQLEHQVISKQPLPASGCNYLHSFVKTA